MAILKNLFVKGTHPRKFCTSKISQYTVCIYVVDLSRKFIQQVIDECLRPENPDPVVVFGSGDTAACKQAQWLAKRLEILKKDHLSVAKVTPTADKQSERFDAVDYFCLTVADKTREVWLLEEGYDAFRKQYNYLCGNLTFAEMSPLPHHVIDHIYLGSRAVLLEGGYLNQLHTTHVILSQQQPIDWGQLTGIAVLKCDVKDTDYQTVGMLPSIL